LWLLLKFTLRQSPASGLPQSKKRVRRKRMQMPFRLNPHRPQTLPAVSFFESFQTPAGLEKTAHIHAAAI